MPNNQASRGRRTHTELALTARTRSQGSSKNLRSCGGGVLLQSSIINASQLFFKQLSASRSLCTFLPAPSSFLSILSYFSLPPGVYPHISRFLRILDCHRPYRMTSPPLSFKLHLPLVTTSFSRRFSVQSLGEFDCPDHLLAPRTCHKTLTNFSFGCVGISCPALVQSASCEMGYHGVLFQQEL